MLPYLSPTSISIFLNDQEKFYLEYMTGVPRQHVQTRPMALGSAFDARFKAYLYKELLGDNPEYSFEALFEKQVTEAQRVAVLGDSQFLWDGYVKSGALADFLTEVNAGLTRSIRFEFKMTQPITIGDKHVVLHGRPDISFIIHHNEPIIVVPDIKVNGYYSKMSPSPIKFYHKARSVNGSYKSHSDYQPGLELPIRYHAGHTLVDCNIEWATQLTIYGWLLGAEVGSRFVQGIEQIVGNGDKLRYASARFLSPDAAWQHSLYEKCCKIWEIVNSDHFFRELSFDDSRRRCELLDLRARMVNMEY